MALNIISNFAANSALTNLTFSSMEATKSVSKLSSGTRVVTAADDAAALAIGSRLRVEVSALSVAAINTAQASSLLQIADGTLARTQDVLNRMKQLTVQAGSENLGSTERGLLDVEFQNLIEEIDRLSDESEFNGRKLFAHQNINEDKYTAPTGSFAGIGELFTAAAAGAPYEMDHSAAGQVINMSITNFNNVITTGGGDGSFQFTISMNNDSDGSAGIGPAAGHETNARDYAFTLSAKTENDHSLQFTTSLDNDLLDNLGNSSSVRLTTGVTLRFELDAVNTQTEVSSFTRENAGFVLSLDRDFDMQHVTQGASTEALTDSFILNAVNPGAFPRDENEQAPTTDFTFKVGTGINPFEDNIAVSWGGVSKENLGLNNQAITTASRADAASLAITFAIDYVVDIRADVGASMNRLETAARNVATMSENMEAARSVLLDLDVADEITTFTSKQILVQAGISVLAQANQLPQNLLRLFA